MTTNALKSPFLTVLMAGLGLMVPAGHVTAQTFTTLHAFTATPYGINNDGASPQAGLILSDNTLYGTAAFGGSSGNGTVFAVSTEGTGFATLHSFAGRPIDGAGPDAGLISSGKTLYGTTRGGGSGIGCKSGCGTVFAVSTDGTGFTNLVSLSDYDLGPNGLTLSSNTLYGTAGESYVGGGTVFALNTDGGGFTTLHTFIGSDGFYPWAGLILSGNTLYGTTYYMVAVRAKAQCSPSTSMATGLRPCIVSRQAPVLMVQLSTATEPIRPPD